VSAETSEQRRRGFGWAMGLAALLPAAYVLSTGPVCMVADKIGVGDGVKDAIRAIYAPLIWLHANTPVREPLQWYLDLWGVK
jgi:hypothetical protein